MRNICFLLGGFQGNGGIGRVTSMLAGLLAESGDFQVTALSYVDTGRPNLYPVSEKITQKFLLDDYQSMGKLLLTGGEQKLRSFLRENDVDVLVACGALFFPIAVRACKGTKTKCLCWEHTDPNTGHDHRCQHLARSYGVKRSCCNVVLTMRAQKYYEKHFPKARTLQIYNPVDNKVLDHARKYDSETKKIISVGRLSYQKYFQMAIEVAAEILPDYPDWQWDIYGEGEQREELEQMILENGLSGQMHLMGQVNDIYDRYHQYAMMVMTSRYEGFPMSLLEGMGNGLPLVSFDINTGPDEIIRDGENGYLIPAFDKQSMCDRMRTLMEKPEQRCAMSSSQKSFCHGFMQKTILTQWKELLKTI